MPKKVSLWLDYKAKGVGYTSYNAFLRSSYWRDFSNSVRSTNCLVCSDTSRLRVHHTTYDRLGKELDTDVVTVCEDCHIKIHEMVGNSCPLDVAHLRLMKENWKPSKKVISAEEQAEIDRRFGERYRLQREAGNILKKKLKLNWRGLKRRIADCAKAEREIDSMLCVLEGIVDPLLIGIRDLTNRLELEQLVERKKQILGRYLDILGSRWLK